ncbi:MAG TPA: hypothetical protein VMV46_06065 [Thermoanaerobaculia bacterium]|nr:hypothetical protein [Thermoanaerobaculia bacterium]
MPSILSPPRARSQPAGVRLLFAATPLLRLILVAALAALGFVVLARDARGATVAASGELLLADVVAPAPAAGSPATIDSAGSAPGARDGH